MKTGSRSGDAVCDHRITVRLDEDTYNALMALLQKLQVEERRRCLVIRNLLGLALKMESHIIVCRLGVLSDEELRVLKVHATLVSRSCNSLANGLRDMPPLDGQQEAVVARWHKAIADCINGVQKADHLIAKINAVVRNRSEPPVILIAAVQQLMKDTNILMQTASEPTRKMSHEKILRQLEGYLRDVQPAG